MKRPSPAAALSAVSLALSAAALGVSVRDAGRLSAYLDAPAAVDPAAVRQALVSDPGMLLDAEKSLRRMQEQRAEADYRATARLVAANAAVLFGPANGSAGSGNTPVVEFCDFASPLCRMAEPYVQQIAKEVRGLKIVFRDAPSLSHGSEAAALAAAAAAREGIYDQVRAALMRAPLPLTRDRVIAAAAAAGADPVRMRKDMDSPEVKADVRRDESLAVSVGVSAVPAFVERGKGVLQGFGGPERLESYLRSPAVTAPGSGGLSP